MGVKKNVFFNFLLTGSNLLFPLITFPYLSRVIGAEGLGISNFIFSYCQNYIIIASLGISIYGTREIARLGEDSQKRSLLFYDLLIIHALFTLSVLIIYFASIFLYEDFKDQKLLMFFGGLHILLSVFSFEWLFQGMSDFKYIAIRSVIVRALSVLAIFFLVKEKSDYDIYFIIIVLTGFTTVIYNVKYSRKYIKKHVAFSFRKAFTHTKPVIVLGFYIVLNSASGQVPPNLLGFLASNVAVGYYFAALKLIQLVITGFSALTQVFYPKLNQIIGEGGITEYKTLIKKLLHIYIGLGIPATVMIFILARPLVLLLGGEGFENSIVCVQIMAPTILMIAFAQIFVLLILSVNRKDKEMTINTTIGLLIGLIINIIFIPYFAEKAAAFSQLFGELSVTVGSFLLAKRALKFDFPVRLFLINLICAIPFALITHAWFQLTDSSIYQLILAGTSCGLYFMFYQFVIIKDRFILELAEPYLIIAGRLLKLKKYKDPNK